MNCVLASSLKLHNFDVYTIFQGVGYPLDILVCSALGADMYDCVYPTRTARFGTALVPEVIGSPSKLVESNVTIAQIKILNCYLTWKVII